MMLEPIHQQKVLPTQYKQQVLPAVTVDTSQLHKQIEQMYSKTVVLPETHSVEVQNFIETPQGIIQTTSPSSGPQILPNQSMPIPIPTQVSVIQPIITQSYNPQLMVSTPNNFQNIYSGSMMLPTYNNQLLINRMLPNLSIYNTSVKRYNPGTVPPTI